MPKINKELSALEVKRLKEGVHFVGGVGGLTLQVSEFSPELRRHPASYATEGRTLVVAEHCELSRSGSNERHNAIACGLGDTTFFDSDRLFGIDGKNSIPGFGDLSAKFVRHASVSKFVCQRLDR